MTCRLRFAINLTLILATTCWSASYAQDEAKPSDREEWLSDWEEEDADEGFQARCRRHQSKIKQCVFETETSTPVAALLAVIQDVDHFTEWAESNAVSKRLPELEDGNELVVYTEYNFSGAYDRFAVTRYNTELFPEEKRVRVRFHTIDKTADIVDESLIRFPLMKGYWQFTEQPSGRTAIAHKSFTLPGGSVQNALHYFYNNAYVDASFDTIRQLIKRAQQAPYLNTEMNWSLD